MKSATATVLTSANPEDENTLDEPDEGHARGPINPQRVRPFRAHFPAHSVTVLQIKVEK